jgi:two-component system LytT family response regulator
MSGLTILVADDEPLARRRLIRQLRKLDWVGLVEESADVAQTLRQMRAIGPDILLLDIQMPGGSGFDVLQQMERDLPAIVFVTAFDHYALRAFEVNAVDYLTKPIDVERFAVAMERARVTAVSRSRADRLAELQEVIASLKKELNGRSRQDAELWVKVRGEHLRIAEDDIIRLQAERDYVRIHVAGASYLFHETLTALGQRLACDAFIRIHRSTIVRRSAVVRLRPAPFAAWIAVLVDGTECRVGRTYASSLRTLLGKR